MRWDFVRDYVFTHEYLYPIVILFITIVLAWTTLHLLEGLLRLFHIKSKAFNHKILSIVETPIIMDAARAAIKDIQTKYPFADIRLLGDIPISEAVPRVFPA